MTDPVEIAAALMALLAAAAHIFMFVNESILFSRPSTLRMLEVEPTHTDAVRLWAFHQGVYNALLAVVAVTGGIALIAGDAPVGRSLLLASFGVMVAAATALLAADRRRSRVAGFLAQALPAAIGIALLLT